MDVSITLNEQMTHEEILNKMAELSADIDKLWVKFEKAIEPVDKDLIHDEISDKSDEIEELRLLTFSEGDRVVTSFLVDIGEIKGTVIVVDADFVLVGFDDYFKCFGKHKNYYAFTVADICRLHKI